VTHEAFPTPLPLTIRSSIQSNELNYESACTWDICSSLVADEMLSCIVVIEEAGQSWKKVIFWTKFMSESCG
jgi:hypothetical protein